MILPVTVSFSRVQCSMLSQQCSLKPSTSKCGALMQIRARKETVHWRCLEQIETRKNAGSQNTDAIAVAQA